LNGRGQIIETLNSAQRTFYEFDRVYFSSYLEIQTLEDLELVLPPFLW
jgi:hypothetical protein